MDDNKKLTLLSSHTPNMLQDHFCSNHQENYPLGMLFYD
jgi:hypothetical protein